jgi:hypothetical protein
LALNASWDEDILRAELAALDQIDFNLELIGFDHDELELLLAVTEADRRPASSLAAMVVFAGSDGVHLFGSTCRALGSGTTLSAAEQTGRICHGLSG